MDFEIKTLIVEEDRPEHISKHSVTVDEVLEILEKDFIYFEGRLGRWLVTGKTAKGRFLTVVVGERKEKHTFGLVTARVAKKKERNFYIEFVSQLGD